MLPIQRQQMRHVRRASVFAILAAALSGCGGVQSAMAPGGPNAEIIATLTWVMIVGGTIIFVFVMSLVAYAILPQRENRRWLGSRKVILWGGVAFPVVVLTALLTYGLMASASIVGRFGDAPVRIQVIGERWWWRVNYLGADGGIDFVTANEIRMPVGERVDFVLESADVIHSFWVPRLGGKLDMIPGRTNTFTLQADAAGVYRGQCAEYCGGPHALMAFDVVAEAPADFAAWAAGQREPARQTAVPFLERGRDLFLSAGCGACHVIRGTEADGTLGPDLTHIGSRLSLAAATFPNNVGTLAGWISDSQHLKPGNLMPSFDVLRGEELRAVAAYLESLK